MTEHENTRGSNQTALIETLVQMTVGMRVTQLIYAAAKLGIADLLKDGSKSSDELAQTLAVHPGALYRVLRALTGYGIFNEIEGGRFQLTPLAEPLRSDVPNSMRVWAILCGEEWLLKAWSQILYSVKTGLPAFDHVHGMSTFEYFQKNPEAGAVFYEAMTNRTTQVSPAVLAAYDFSRARSVVDVGCGNGTFAAAILKAHPHLRGVLFDLPHVIANARNVIKSEGIEERCEFVAGDLFESVPPGGEIYILKHVIHDWNDDLAVTIFKNCRKVMADDGKVLVVEMVIAPGNESSPARIFDISMLVNEGGQERTGTEYGALFQAAGLRLSRIIPTRSHVSVIEAVPV